MKELPPQFGQDRFAGAQVSRGSIEGIPNQRVLQRGEVHTNLMRSPGVELDCEEGGRSEIREFLPFRKRLAGASSKAGSAASCVVGEGLHAGTAHGIAADR